METQKTQTAVDWLLDCMIAQGYAKDTALFRDIVSEARNRERTQIMKAVYDGMGTNFDPNMGRAEQYYEENYGK